MKSIAPIKMAKLKLRYSRSSGLGEGKAYIWYVEHPQERSDAGDRFFYDAINTLEE
jgi:hypothetical protein